MKRLTMSGPALLAGILLFAPALVGQRTMPVPAPDNVLKAFDISSGSLQNLDLPRSLPASFEFRVVLGGQQHRVTLRAHSMRAPGFKLYEQDAKGLHEVKAPPENTYRGSVDNRQDSGVAASLVDGQLEATIALGTAVWNIQSASKVFKNIGPRAHIVYLAKDTLPLPFKCGNDELVMDHDSHKNIQTPQALKLCEIAIDADFWFYTANGSNTTRTQNDVTSVMNGVDFIYKRDVTITYKITQIVVRTSQVYTSNSPGTLLNQFRSRWNAFHRGIKRDVAHLFTGRNLSGSVIGVAWLSVICNIGSGYGLSQSRFTSNYNARVALTAHELGHNWSARHCSGSGCNIMCPGLGGCSRIITSFGQASKNQIIAFKNTRGCLSDPAPPTITSLAPSTVKAFGAATVKVTGKGLSGATRVVVGATTMTSGFLIKSDTELQFTPPAPTALGNTQVRVGNSNGLSKPLTLTYVATKPPALSAPAVALVVFPAAVDFGAGPGDLWVLLAAGNNQTFKFLGNDILLNLVILSGGTTNSVGLGKYNYTPPAILRGQRVFWQIATFSGKSWAGASNIGSTFYL